MSANKKASQKLRSSLKYGRGDSNSHTSRHQILSLACLPIPPRPHIPPDSYRDYRDANIKISFDIQTPQLRKKCLWFCIFE